MRIRLQAPQDRALLPSLFVAIDDALVRAGIAAEVVDDVRLVTEEIVCNAIDHGALPGAPHAVTVDIGVGDGRVVLEYRDDGRPFDPLAQPPPDLDADIDARPIGGLGVHLVRSLADEIHYAREGGHNVLRVVLRLPDPPAPSATEDAP